MAIAGLVLGYAGLAMIPIILIIAAIAIPNLLRARMAANESSAVAAVRTINTAEVSYYTMHPDAGYTCSLAELGSAGLIDAGLASGERHGYVFRFSGCGPSGSEGANPHYHLLAYPAARNTTGTRSFCSDESMVVKADPKGSIEDCLENGTSL